MARTEAAVVLLHGFTLTGRSWAPVRAALPACLPVVAPDLRGHGEAGDLEPVTLASVQSDLQAVVRPGSVLVGYSMGGRLALHAALAPDLAARFDRLVLIGASPGLADPGERAARRAADEALAAELETMTIEQFAARWEKTCVLGGQPSGVLERLREDRLRSRPSGLARALRGLGTGALPSLWHRLDELSVPVTLIVGERDKKFHHIAERMAPRIPDVRLLVIGASGHAAHLEAPEQIAAAILDGG